MDARFPAAFCNKSRRFPVLTNVPTDLIHRVGIEASPEKIYRAVTTEEGIRGWWTVDVKMDSRVGGKAVFGFMKHAVEFQMQIDTLTPGLLVQWTCIGGNS